MPAVKDVMRHITIEVAGKKRKCYRQPSKHVIAKGERCLVVADGPQDRSTYCVTCACEILRLAQVRLTHLSQEMVGSP
jgi:hypothetical protein